MVLELLNWAAERKPNVACVSRVRFDLDRTGVLPFHELCNELGAEAGTCGTLLLGTHIVGPGQGKARSPVLTG